MSIESSETNRPGSRFRLGLASRLAIWLTLGMCAVLVVHFYTTIRRERLLFERTKEQYGRLLAKSLASRVSDTWDLGREGRAQILEQELEELGEHLSIRWIPLNADASADTVLSAHQRDMLAKGTAVTLIHKEGERESFHTFAPVPPPGEGAVVVVDSFSDREFYIQASVRRFLVALGVIIVLNAFLALALGAWFVTRPFAKLVEKARQVGSGNLTVPVRFASRDEIGDLAHEMERMSRNLLEAKVKLEAEELARRKVEEDLQHAERLATIGKLAAGVAHELGTPLNVISGRAARLARRHEHDSATKEEAAIIRSQVDRVTRIVQQLLHFARRRRARKSDVNLLELIRSTVSDVEPTLGPGMRLSLHLDDEANTQIELDSGQIQQVLTNLIINAAQAMPMGGLIGVNLSKQRAQPPSGSAEDQDDYYCLSVEDRGCGISPDDLPHIFEPFFTTKDIGEGTGLGLAVAHGIVNEHGGWIEVNTEEGKGTRFTVYLPGAES